MLGILSRQCLPNCDGEAWPVPSAIAANSWTQSARDVVRILASRVVPACDGRSVESSRLCSDGVAPRLAGEGMKLGLERTVLGWCRKQAADDAEAKLRPSPMGRTRAFVTHRGSSGARSLGPAHGQPHNPSRPAWL